MNESSKSSINSSLRQERLLRGWSQQALADQLGTTIVTVSRWERGIQYPGPMMRLKLCTLFEKTESELGLFAEENKEAPSSQSSENASAATSASNPPPTPIATSETEAAADETVEEATLADPGSISDSTEEADSAPPDGEREKQIAERKLPVRQMPFKGTRPWFPSGRASAQWVIALACILLLAIVASLLLGLYHSPRALSRGSVVTVRTTSGADAVPAVYGVKGKLVFDNTLRDEQNGKLWEVDTDPHKVTGCHFLNDAYDMRDTESNYCLASDTNFTNFVYQIEMTTIQEQNGQTGRILFRADDTQHTYYDFQVGADGSYFLTRNSATDDTTLLEGRSPAIVKGDLQSNLLAVKADGEDLSLYVNDHLIGHTQDLSYTNGNIGVGIDVNAGAGETEIAFRDAKVWAL